MLPHDLRRPQAVINIVNRQNQNLSRIGAGGPTQVQPRGVAVIDLVAKVFDEVYLIGGNVEGRRGDLPGGQNAPDNLTDTSESDNDDGIVLLIDYIICRIDTGRDAACNYVAGHQQELRCHH